MPGQPSNAGAGNRWFPSVAQLQDPQKVEVAFRQTLQTLYALQDRLAAIEGTRGGVAPAGPPLGSGPVDTMLLGLRVAPVDAKTLADGATLQYDKAAGNFKFA